MSCRLQTRPGRVGSGGRPGAVRATACHPARRLVRRAGRNPQSGAALLLAMVILTFVTTIAAGMVWQQWRGIQVEEAERARAQSAWILNGALDWARLILREDARSGGADHLGEPWAVPLAEARISTFLASDKNNAEDAPEAFLSGSIADEQSRYNLNHLMNDGKLVPAQLAMLQRLCESAGLSSDVAQRLAEGLLAATRGDPDATLLPQTVAQLVWLGLDAATVERLAPWVTLLPGSAPVNLNTAPREVIAAVIDGLDLASAERLVQSRQRQPFKTVDDARAVLSTTAKLDFSGVGVASSYFEIRGRLRLEQRVLEERSLVQRRQLEVVPLRRERINLFAG